MHTRSHWPRRTFLSALSATRLATGADPVSSAPLLPTLALGPHKVTRLVAGYNPIGGYSHSVPKLSAIMRNWFTRDRVVEFLLACERNGIDTWQASIDPKAFQALQLAREAGSKIQWICLMPDTTPAQWREVLDLKPLAVVHHGEATDKLYRAGEQRKITDFLHKAHDAGILAGISSHVPDHIARCEDSPWSHDFYMTCFYNIRRDPSLVKAGLGALPVDELYLSQDPEKMTAVVRQVKRPCLGFKLIFNSAREIFPASD